MQAQDQAWNNMLQDVEDMMRTQPETEYFRQQKSQVEFPLEDVHFLDVHHQPIVFFPTPEVQEEKKEHVPVLEPEVLFIREDYYLEMDFVPEDSDSEVQSTHEDAAPDVQSVSEDSAPEVQFTRNAPPTHLNSFTLKFKSLRK